MLGIFMAHYIAKCCGCFVLFALGKLPQVGLEMGGAWKVPSWLGRRVCPASPGFQLPGPPGWHCRTNVQCFFCQTIDGALHLNHLESSGEEEAIHFHVFNNILMNDGSLAGPISTQACEGEERNGGLQEARV